MIQMEMNRAPLVGPFYFITAGALFAGSNTAVQGAGMLHGVPAPTIAFWQYAIALVAVLPLLWRAGLRTQHLVAHIGRVVLAAIGVQLWISGLAHVPIWQAVALILTSPVFVTLGAWIFLREQMTAPRIVALLAGAFGGCIILAPWHDDFTFAAVLPVAAAAFWAASSLIAKRLTATESAGTLTLYLFVLLVPINFALSWQAGFAVGASGLWLVALAGLAVAAAQYLLVRAYVLCDAAYLQPFDHLKLPLNVMLGLIFFGFAPAGTMWIGAAIIIVASAWLLREEA
ncbi:DMT family transporter [Yoonia sp. BS5-3]|uniref:DMT family transporter n=1 Tax=Yoonia phaeophyticola TaxID=3137369 RepID=A0ABZ2V434_9RHOB